MIFQGKWKWCWVLHPSTAHTAMPNQGGLSRLAELASSSMGASDGALANQLAYSKQKADPCGVQMGQAVLHQNGFRDRTTGLEPTTRRGHGRIGLCYFPMDGTGTLSGCVSSWRTANPEAWAW